jgi:signal transduction histidine kinase
MKVDADDSLHDSGLRLGDVLARLLPVGVLIVGDRDGCRYASPRACAAFGVDDDAALANAWRDIAVHVGAERWSLLRIDATPLQILSDVPMDAGARRLRLEVHRITGASIVLVRNVHAEDAADRTLLLASETQAQRRALSGLVHDAKGPLNNFQLTLTLLNAGLSRLEARAAAIDVTARWRRHVDVLQSETERLAARLAEIDTLSHAVESEWTSVDVAAVLRDVTRMLRHEATMNELAIEIDAPADPIAVRGDPRALQLALLGLTACIFDATPAGGVVRLRGKRHGGDDVHIGIDATTAELPADLQTAMFRIGCAVDARYTTASAGRAIIEAHGGNIGVHADNGARRGFDIELPGG